MRNLIAQGKVRAIGASNISAGAAEGLACRQQDGSASRATKACSRTTISTTARISRPIRADLPGRGARRHHLLFARRRLSHRQIPLARRKPPKHPARGGKVKNYFDARGAGDSRERSMRWRRATSATPAQIALAWLIARPLVTAPIASATSLGAARRHHAGAADQAVARRHRRARQAPAPEKVEGAPRGTRAPSLPNARTKSS